MISPQDRLQQLQDRGVRLRLRDGRLQVMGTISAGERVVLRVLDVFDLLEPQGDGVVLAPGTDPPDQGDHHADVALVHQLDLLDDADERDAPRVSG